MQANTQLQAMYTRKIQRHLAEHEKQKLRKKSKKVLGDGMPQLFTGDEFHKIVVEHDEAMKRAAEEKKE